MAKKGFLDQLGDLLRGVGQTASDVGTGALYGFDTAARRVAADASGLLGSAGVQGGYQAQQRLNNQVRANEQILNRNPITRTTGTLTSGLVAPGNFAYQAAFKPAFKTPLSAARSTAGFMTGNTGYGIEQGINTGLNALQVATIPMSAKLPIVGTKPLIAFNPVRNATGNALTALRTNQPMDDLSQILGNESSLSQGLDIQNPLLALGVDTLSDPTVLPSATRLAFRATAPTLNILGNGLVKGGRLGLQGLNRAVNGPQVLNTRDLQAASRAIQRVYNPNELSNIKQLIAQADSGDDVAANLLRKLVVKEYPAIKDRANSLTHGVLADIGRALFDGTERDLAKMSSSINRRIGSSGFASTDVLLPGGKQIAEKLGKKRGLTKSVQEAANVAPEVKSGVTGTYTPKSNQTLMGEAQALLQDSASIDFKNTKDLDKKVAATIQEAINRQGQGDHAAAAALFNNLSEHATELGRSVQAFSLLKNMSPESVALSVAGRIKKFNATHSTKIPELTAEQTKLISEKVAAIDLLNGREKNLAMHELQETLNNFFPSSKIDKALTVWKAGLLTSLRTHERNFVGNTLHQIAETAKDLPATAADIAMSGRTGTRTKTFSTRGFGSFGSKSTRDQVKDIVAKGYDPEEQINKFDYRRVTWGSSKLEQGLKKYTEAVFRTLGASDKPFYNAAMARSLYDQAAAAAINAGKRGDKEFIESLVRSPTEDMLKAAIKDANVATFKNENQIRSVAGSLKRQLGTTEAGRIVGEVLMPFTGVPSSIFGQVIDYSPIGLLKGMARAVRVTPQNAAELQRQAASEIGRGVIGSGVFALGAFLASRGLITGQPKDQAEARQWELENKPRNSIFIGGKWRSLNSIGPEAVVMLAGSKLSEMLQNPEGTFGEYATTIGKDLLDQSFVQGIQGPVNALTDPARYGKSYAGNLLSSPIPNIVKDLAKATDDKNREMNTVTDYAKSGIPWVRQSLTERRDVLGNSIAQEPGGIGAFIDLFNSKTPITGSPIVDELARLNGTNNNATPSKLRKDQSIKGQKVTLTPQQLNKLEAGSGIIVQQALSELISSPEYQLMNDVDRAEAIDKTVQDARGYFKDNISSIDALADPSQADTSQQNAARWAAKSTGTPVRLTSSGGQSMNIAGTFAQKKAVLSLQKKFNALDDSASALGRSRAASKRESAIKAVYSAWLDGDITEKQADEIFASQKIDPQDAEFTYVRSINDDEVAPYIMEKLQSGDTDVATLIREKVLTANVAKKMAEQGLISWDQYDGLKSLISTKTGSGGRGRAKKPKAIRITRSKRQPTVKFVSLDMTPSSTKIAGPKLTPIRV